MLGESISSFIIKLFLSQKNAFFCDVAAVTKFRLGNIQKSKTKSEGPKLSEISR